MPKSDSLEPLGGKRFQMTWSTVKWIALVSMTIDHIAKVLPFQLIAWTYFSMDLPTSSMILQVMETIGRIAFPIFAYGIAQGCMYTGNIRKYPFRLLLFAVISEVPYQLANHRGALHIGCTNMIFTLLIGAICCLIIKFFRERSKMWIAVFPIALLILVAERCGVDGGGLSICLIIFPYLFFKDRKKSIFALGIATAFLYVCVLPFRGFSWPVFGWATNSVSFWGMVLSTGAALVGVLLVALYNGEKGNAKSKWVFYFYYPIHFTILYILSLVIPVVLP